MEGTHPPRCLLSLVETQITEEVLGISKDPFLENDHISHVYPLPERYLSKNTHHHQFYSSVIKTDIINIVAETFHLL